MMIRFIDDPTPEDPMSHPVPNITTDEFIYGTETWSIVDTSHSIDEPFMPGDVPKYMFRHRCKQIQAFGKKEWQSYRDFCIYRTGVFQKCGYCNEKMPDEIKTIFILLVDWT